MINRNILISGAEYFNDNFAINPYMDEKILVNTKRAIAEHREIVRCFQQANIQVIDVTPPIDCQDGVYTANWALVVENKAFMSNLPNKRKDEEPYAEMVLSGLGLEIIKMPNDVRFSGQGDALICDNYLFIGSHYRTDLQAHHIIGEQTDLNIIGLQTVPQLDERYKPVINPVTGWPDSFFYDLDLALAVIGPNLIAWCPDAFIPESQAKINSLTELEKIEVSIKEATDGFACNLVSTGETVIMSNKAPGLKQELENRGLKVLTPSVKELLKGGGFIRCVSLTL